MLPQSSIKRPKTSGIILEYPRDALRYKYFVKESNTHQAKMELRTFKWIVENYTSPGDVILDPMSGVGTIHFANFMGRNTVAVELVPEFVALQRKNINYLINIHLEGIFYDITDMGDWDFTSLMGDEGKHIILEGDNRRLLPLDTPVDACIFSPPYGGLWAFKKGSRESKIAQEKNYQVGYDDSDANVGNLSNYAAYLVAMEIIYKKVFASLVPGAPLVSVVKDYVLNARRVYCSKDNLRLMMKVGFMPEAWHFRRTNMQNNPFSAGNRAKRIAAGKHTPELDIDFEDILVVRKPI